jgi:hypothetical protein
VTAAQSLRRSAAQLSQLFEIEKSFRMSKHDLEARPIYHHHRDSIEAHLTMVVRRRRSQPRDRGRTGWSVRKFVRTARRS